MRRGSVRVGRGSVRVRCGSVGSGELSDGAAWAQTGCGVAQLVARRLAVWPELDS
jgi:hypothetical protein